jgi:predicted HicB family RNase H-like nuclease
MSKKKEPRPARSRRAADYLKIVEWSAEDGCFVGSAPPIIGPACHGVDEVAVYEELCGIVEEWLEIIARDGVPIPAPILGKRYSGKFNLRIGSELHKALEIRATQAGDSLNAYCVKKLTDAVLSNDTSALPRVGTGK